MFDWQDARFFLAVQRAGTLSGAARRLGVNQSTVGRRLAALEEALGAQLFVRARDGYVPTDTGAELVPRFEAIETEALAVERQLAGAAQQVAGRVRVTAPLAFTSLFLAARIPALLRRHPDLELEVVAENQTLSLTKREADVALRFQRPTGGHLKTRKIGEVGWALYASRGYLARRGRPRNGDFTGHAVLGFGDVFGLAQEGAWLARHTRGATTPILSDDGHSRLMATVAGAGIALLPHYVARQAKRLERVSARNVVVRQVWLVVHEDLAHAGRIRTTADYLAEVVRSESATLMGH